MYKPLPDYVEIRTSPIHGVGLFAKAPIKKGTNLGVAHILIPHSDDIFAQSYSRTPLGGFYNHSDDPNCVIKSKIHYFASSSDYKRLVTTIMELFTKKNIKKGQELTCKYVLYNMNEKKAKVN